MSEAPYDVTIVGAGPGGYVAAIRAAHNGLKTLLVEETFLGGICLNVGCIPSKALIHAADLASVHRRSAKLGIKYGPPEIDFSKVIAWKDGVVSRLTKGVERLVAARGAEIRTGRGRLAGPGHVEITAPDGEKTRVATRNVVLATGSRPVQIPGFAYDRERIWTSTEALGAAEVPGRLVVIGGGVIGLELSQAFAGFGSRVTVVEMEDQVLPGTPRDLLQPLSSQLRRQKIAVLTSSKALGFEEREGALALQVEGKGGGHEICCDRVLVSVGRRPNSEDLGLETVGIEPGEGGFIPVNTYLETDVEGVYAIGDLSGAPLLAHRASKMGEVCADVIAGKAVEYDPEAVPAVVYTHPEIAVTGYSEAQVRELGADCVVGKFPFAANGRAMSMDDTSGFVKVIADREDGTLFGVQAVGPNVSELIAEGTLAVETGAALEDLASTVHPHPSLSEALMEAAMAALGHAVHVLPR